MPPVTQSEPARVAAGTALAVGALVVLTDLRVQETLPIVLFAGVGIGTRYAVDRYDLSAGTNGVVFGSLLAIGGGLVVLQYDIPVAGAGLAVAGGWFVLDGLTRMRYGTKRSRHPYVDGVEASDEVFHRMLVLNRVYRTLQEGAEIKTPATVAERCTITTERAEGALEYLASRGRIEPVGDGYRAVPSRWGRLTPLVKGVVWLPRRLFRPVRRLATGG